MIQPIDPNTVQAREMLALGGIALYSVAKVEALERELAEARKAFTDYKNSPAHIGAPPRWLEDEINECRVTHKGFMCDSEDLCNEHLLKARAWIADSRAARAPVVVVSSQPAELDLTRTRREMLHHEDLPTS